MPQVNYRGQQFNFPDDSTIDEIHNHLNRYDVMNPPSNLPNPASPSSPENPIPQFTHRDAQNLAAKNFVGSLIPAAGATAGSMAGPGGGIAGAIGGSAIKQILQEHAPEVFGEAPKDTSGTISGIAKDALLQGIIPEVAGKIPMLGRYLASKVTSANPTVGKYITNKLQGMTTPSASEMPGDFPPSGVSTEQTALNQAVRTGYKDINNVDIDAIQNELAGKSKFYDKALSPETQDNLTSFLKKAKDLEPDPQSSGVDSILRYAKHRLAFDIIAGAVGGHEAGLVGTAGALSTVYIGRAAFSKLMSWDMMGKLAIQALETPGTSEQAKAISQALMYGMRGTDVMFVDSQGNKEKAQISNDGQLQLKPSSSQTP